jgi:hypothetical protein
VADQVLLPGSRVASVVAALADDDRAVARTTVKGAAAALAFGEVVARTAEEIVLARVAPHGVGFSATVDGRTCTVPSGFDDS